MYPAPDMSLWQGRIDSQEGADARRWHQWMRPYADDAEAASVLLGFASDACSRAATGWSAWAAATKSPTPASPASPAT